MKEIKCKVCPHGPPLPTCLPLVPHHTSLAPTHPGTYWRSTVPFLPRKSWALASSDSSGLSLQDRKQWTGFRVWEP